jgi:hypothetical protein
MTTSGMKGLSLLASVFFAVCCHTVANAEEANAEEDSDLDRIPAITPAPSAPPSTDVGTADQHKVFWETAGAAAGFRSNLAAPLPAGSSRTNAEARSSIDLTAHQEWTDRLSATVSDRADLRLRDDLSLPSHQMIANNLRETYLTFEPLSRTYVEAGRINQRDGIALGFNPTDFFKTRSLVAQANADPSALRNNRLGTFMVRGQTLWDDGSMGVIAAPKLADAAPVSVTDDGGLSLHADRTNAANRLQLLVSQEVGDFSPQASLYHEDNRTCWGLNLSHPLGQSIIIYGEWAGGRQEGMMAEAIAFGKKTGTIPAMAATPGFANASATFRNDAAIGFSWTSSEKVTINLEYLEHQAGLSRRDWNAWFASGSTGNPATRGLLWYLRSYAADQQTLLSRRQIFLRADWTDAFVSNLELTAFAFVNPDDGSLLSQISANYDLSEHWSFGAFLSTRQGSTRTEQGSLPEENTITLQAVRYF